jgi:holo-[acyl-carrier protein] synthase
MIIGIGTDIVEVSRFMPDKLAENILGSEEMIEYAKANNKPAYLAKRFAAKEACIKATGVIAPVYEIQILSKKSGAPYVQSHHMDDYYVHLTISDEKDYAVAFAVAETR